MPTTSAGKTSRLLRSVKFPGPNQPEFEANSTSGSARVAAITATAKQNGRYFDEALKPNALPVPRSRPLSANSQSFDSAQDDTGIKGSCRSGAGRFGILLRR